MNTITLTLPDAVYNQLERLAQSEGLSLYQYLVNAVTAQAVSGYRVRATSEQDRFQQREAFLALLNSLGDAASEEEIDLVLAEREEIQPEPELSAETVFKFRNMINRLKRSK